MKNKIFLIVMLPILISLTGCASMNSNFDCPMKPGIMCASLDEVNAKVDRGEIGNEPIELTYHPLNNKPFHQARLLEPASCDDNPEIRKPLRYGESVMRVWVAPFEDTVGNYHKESDIYTIVKPGHWIGYPVKAINDDEE